MKGDGRRPQRVAERVRAHVADVLLKLGDPSLALLVITGVEVTDDLGIARVRVRALDDEPDPKAREKVLRSLRRAAGRLRRGLGQELKIKRTPELQFFYDAGHDNERRVTGILDEIHQEQSQRASGDTAGPEADSD